MAKTEPVSDVNYADAIVEHFNALSFDEQKSILKTLQDTMASVIEAKKAELRASLAELEALAPGPSGSAPKHAGEREGRERTTLPPKYRSLKEPSVTWTGRGNEPRWLTAEMAETGKPKDAFKIDASSE